MSTSSSSSTSSTNPLTCWCHECDMSVHLLLPNPTPTNPTLLCPQCHLDFLELMDPPDPIDPTDFTFLLPEKPDPTDDLPLLPSSSSASHYFSLLPSVKIPPPPSHEEEEDQLLPCAVCKDAFVPNEEAKRLPCLHLFHSSCILPWLSSGHPSCPLCRFHLAPFPPSFDEEEERCFAPPSSTASAAAAPPTSLPALIR